jgi:hypothetical protein
MSQTGQEAVDVSQCGSNGRLNLEVGRWPLLTVGIKGWPRFSASCA